MAATAPPPTPGRPGSPEHAAPVTDFALIEAQKENIRPLAGGRSAATLGVLFDKGASDEAARARDDGEAQFKADIEEAERRDREGEDMVDGVQDVLDVYNRFVAFTVQHYPSSPSHVLPLLEKTTRRFIDDARYAQDARYLKLWIMYARQVERREDVWAFLESRDVGTRHASFYEEWAMSAEGTGRKKKADDVYKLGIARKAAPVERLKNRHQAFLTRIMAPPSGLVPDDDPPVSRSSRNVLGQVAGGSSSAGLSGAQATPSQGSRSRGTNSCKMEIFDESARAAVNPEAATWDDFGTRDGRRKENTVEATPWKGETLPQGSARFRVAPRTPKLEVFKDTTADNATPSVRPADDILSGSIRGKTPMSEGDQLRADPLRFYDQAAIPGEIPKLPSPPKSARKPAAKKVKREHRADKHVIQAWVCPSDGAEIVDARGKPERRMFDWDATFRGGEEYSFEEVRARKLGLLGKDWKPEVKDWERGWHKPGSTTPKVEKKVRPPSPTLNTKLANAEVMSLFNQTIHGGKVRSDSDDDSEDDEEDEGDDEVAGLPTPLPPRFSSVSMMTPGAGVPPTPTPAPHARMAPPSTPMVFADENAPVSTRKMNIFSDENAANDENAPPASARKINVFATPAKTPLATRTPLASSSRRPFGVFTPAAEQPEEEAAAMHDENENAGARRNIFATPASLGSKPRTGLRVLTVPEEPEPEPETEQVYDENAYGNNENAFNNENVYPDENDEQRRWYGRNVAANVMTPITERTCEYTDYTTGNRTSRRFSALSETGDSDEPMLPSAGTLASVLEEEERSQSAGAASPAQPSAESGSRDPSSRRSSERTSEYDRSGTVDTGAFGVPEGYTIQRSADVDSATALMDHMVVVDHTTTANLTTHSDTGAFVTATMGAVSPAKAVVPQAKLANPCNPGDEAVVAALLQRIDPPLSALPAFVDNRDETSARLPAIERAIKMKTRRSSTASRVSLAPEADAYVLDLGTRYEIRDKLGEGGFGAVFLGVDTAAYSAALAEQDAADSDDEDAAEAGAAAAEAALTAFKIEKPGSIWEAVVLDRVHSRLPASLTRSVVRPRGLHVFADESYLMLDYSSQGTLLDLVNRAAAWGVSPIPNGPSIPEELLAIFFTAELLRLVEGLHAAGFIHGDLKIDNCLVRLDSIPADEGGATAWAGAYARDGSKGWKHKGVRLIDFGRGADMTLFPAGEKQRFIADWKTDQRDCIEMREGRDWSYETDYFGLASICYCLLFGKYIATEVVENTEGRQVKIDQPLRRYWQTDMWQRLFDTLLNPRSLRAEGALPITSELGALRNEFETYLEENCARNGKNLKQMLKRVELRAMEARRV